MTRIRDRVLTVVVLAGLTLLIGGSTSAAPDNARDVLVVNGVDESVPVSVQGEVSVRGEVDQPLTEGNFFLPISLSPGGLQRASLGTMNLSMLTFSGLAEEKVLFSFRDPSVGIALEFSSSPSNPAPPVISFPQRVPVDEVLVLCDPSSSAPCEFTVTLLSS